MKSKECLDKIKLGISLPSFLILFYVYSCTEEEIFEVLVQKVKRVNVLIYWWMVQDDPENGELNIQTNIMA